MEVSNYFEINKEDNKVILTQKIVKTMDINEAIKHVKGLNDEILQMRNKSLELNKAITEDRITKDLNQIDEQIEILDNLRENWNKLIKEDLDKLKQEIKGKIKVLKAEYGYDRINKKDTNARIVKANEIMAKIVVEHNLERNDQIIIELRQKFDDIWKQIVDKAEMVFVANIKVWEVKSMAIDYFDDKEED